MYTNEKEERTTWKTIKRTNYQISSSKNELKKI